MFNLITTYFFSMFTIHLINVLQGDIALNSLMAILLGLLLAVFVFLIFQFETSKYLFVITYVIFVIPNINADMVFPSVAFLTFGWLTLLFKRIFKSEIYAGKTDISNPYSPATYLDLNLQNRKNLTIPNVNDSESYLFFKQDESKIFSSDLFNIDTEDYHNDLITDPTYSSLSCNIYFDHNEHYDYK